MCCVVFCYVVLGWVVLGCVVVRCVVQRIIGLCRLVPCVDVLCGVVL